MILLNLVKGDENNLQGRVLVYSILNSDNYLSKLKNGEIFSLYASNDANDFVEKTKKPLESVEYKRLENQLYKMVAEMFGLNIEHINFYVSPIEIESEKELHNFKTDILFTGNYSHPNLCTNIVKSGMDFYILQWIEQTLKKELSQTTTSNKTKLENLQEELEKLIKIENYEAAEVIKKQINDLLKH